MPLDQNSHQTVARFGCVDFSMYACEFPVPQMRRFCLFTYLPRSKWASSVKMIFSKIGIFCKSITGPLSEAKTHWMLNWLQLLKQLDFVLASYQGLYAKFVLIFNCWERRWIDVDGSSRTLSVTAAIFWGVRSVFGFSRFGLTMRMPVSLTFSQDNEHTELTVLRERLIDVDGASRTLSTTTAIFSGVRSVFDVLV